MTPEDAHALAGVMRPCDLEDLEAGMPGMSPAEAILHLYERSVPAWAWVVADEVLAVCGVARIDDHPRKGQAWILSSRTRGDRARAVDFHRAAVRGLCLVDVCYDAVVAFSGADLRGHHRWIESLGFERAGTTADGRLAVFWRWSL